MQSNVNGIMDEYNEFPDSWVEIYNDDTLAFDFTEYSVSPSNDFTESYPLMDSTIIPAKGFLLIYCDKEDYGNRHADFRLDPDGQTLYIFDPVGHIVDSLQVPEMLAPNVAYGRITDGADSLSWFKTATPATANTGFYSDKILKKPKFSVNGGVYDHPVSLHLSLQGECPSDAVIRYTTNGSEPTEDSPIAPDSIFIDHTTAIRAKTFSDSALSKMSKTESFIILDRKINLPVISLSIDSSYLWNDTIGIYTEGTYADFHPDAKSEIPELGAMNYLFNWHRPVNFEFFSAVDKESDINQLCEVNIGGNASRLIKLKSLVLKSNKRFGEKYFSYPFWNSKPNVKKNKSLYLRNSGQDYYWTHLKDAFIQMSFAKYIDLDYSAYQPAIVYVNGEYWGILNIRERGNEDFAWANYGEKDVDVIQGFYGLVKNGTVDDYNVFRSKYLSNTSTYSQLDSLMDVNEFLNYFVMNAFYSNTDFPGNNVQMWKAKNADGRWRWLAKDMDMGMCDSVADLKYFNYILRKPPFLDKGGFNSESACALFIKMMSFPQFENAFVDRASVYMGTFAKPDVVASLLDSLSGNIESEIPYFYCSKFIARPTSIWYDSISAFRKWAAKRAPFLYNDMHTFFKLGDTVSLSVKSFKGTPLFFNGVNVQKNRFIGKYYVDRPLYLSHSDSAFSYVGDSIVINKNDSSKKGRGQWFVLYKKLNNQVVDKYEGESFYYSLKKDMKRVLITDSLFIDVPDCKNLPPVTVPLTTYDYFVPSSVVESPVGYNIYGDTLFGNRIDKVDSLLIGENSLVWQFTDEFGDTLVCPQKAIVHDSVAPVVDNLALAPFVLYLDSAHCSIDSSLVNLYSPVAWDNSLVNIKGKLTDSLETYATGSYELEWTFSDAASNTLISNQNLLVVDTIRPVYDLCDTMPVLHFAVSDNRCSISSKELVFDVPIATDNCGSISGELSVPDSLPIGQNVAVWTFADESGNSLVCNQQIEVADSSVPYYELCDSMPELRFSITDNSCSLALTDMDMEIPVALDNCGVLVEGKFDSAATASIGENVVDWNFVDEAGNKTVCHQTVVVSDGFAPVIDCSSLPTLSFDLFDNSRGLPFDSVQIEAPLAYDNCGQFVKGQMQPVDTLYLETNVVDWTFVDAAGNGSWCPQTVIVLDKAAPEYRACNSMPKLTADITSSQCQFPTSSVSFEVPVADDNGRQLEGRLVAPDSLPIGVNMVYWTFTDASGNNLACTQLVEIRDAFAPQPDCEKIAPIVTDLYNNSCGIPSDSINFVPPYAVDNCGQIVTGQLYGTPEMFTIGNNEVAWLFIDDAGNASSCPQEVVVMDKMPPVVDCAAIDTITIDLAQNANDVVKEAVAVPLQYAVDNCNTMVTGSLLAEDVYRIGSNVAWWAFTDASGNISTCQQIVVANKHFKVEVYPNPTSDFVYVAGTEVGEGMRLMNVSGQLLRKIYSMGNPMLIDVRNYPDGIYLLKVKDQIYKILKEE